ncbi:hypothetical protein DPMN_101172 [Dreissena polymorpha]|uniref:Uncharacterized protein n=1 Tax=Dreissena polymorpha TaxID=45954 RepID=A0A9D4LIF1_DREPO|nr:hypothetical protein DPMN_101172 [Dreissena polymorpha]
MDKELDDEETRNWVKVCLALRCLTKSLVSYIKKKSVDQYSNNVTFLTKCVRVPEYTCSSCNLKTLEPYHSQRTPCKYLHVKYKCACSASGKQQCPEKTCGKIYDLIKDEHVENNPNWLNSKSELWSDKQSGPWERMKCFIDTQGYNDKSDIFLADISALVQICTNNGNLVREIGSTNLSYLQKKVTNVEKDMKPILEKTARSMEVVERLEQKFDEFGRQLKRFDAPGMKLIVELKTSTGAETASELLVESSNGILRDGPITELQKMSEISFR